MIKALLPLSCKALGFALLLVLALFTGSHTQDAAGEPTPGKGDGVTLTGLARPSLGMVDT